MKPCHRRSTGGDEQLLHNILGREKPTRLLQNGPDDSLADHIMAYIAHLSAPPKTRIDEGLNRILARLLSSSYTVASQSSVPPSFKNI